MSNIIDLLKRDLNDFKKKLEDKKDDFDKLLNEIEDFKCEIKKREEVLKSEKILNLYINIISKRDG